MKKLFLILTMCFASTTALNSHAAAEPTAQTLISKNYALGHNLLASAALTTYYAIADANEQSQDAKEWNFDFITFFNIIWRTVLFGFINYYDYDYLQAHKAELGPRYYEIKKIIALLATTAGMLTYNSRYNKVIINRFNDVKEMLSASMPEGAATCLSVLNILMRNLIWWYTIPVFLKPFNDFVLSFFATQREVAFALYSKTHAMLGMTTATIAAYGLYSLIDLLYKHAVVSTKHTLWQFLPMPSNFNIGRFEDCTSCYLGTNMFGKSGPLFKAGAALESALHNIPLFWEGFKDQLTANQLTQPMSTLLPATHTTQPYCGTLNPTCVF
jgi:hypothetical protein